MNGAGCNELLEACTSPTTLPGRLDRESFHSTRVADDTFGLPLGHGFGVVFWGGGDSQINGRYRTWIGAANQGDSPTTDGRCGFNRSIHSEVRRPDTWFIVLRGNRGKVALSPLQRMMTNVRRPENVANYPNRFF